MISRFGFLASGEGASPVIPKPAEIIVGFIAFGILFFILRTRAVPKFEKAYKDRTEAIQGGLELSLIHI
jgi:F-type H+-transporting ATPase subunit b